jgi:hypothetical protein
MLNKTLFEFLFNGKKENLVDQSYLNEKILFNVFFIRSKEIIKWSFLLNLFN